MQKVFDRNMFIAAYLFLAIPMLIFLIGWTALHVAIPSSIILLVSLWFAIKSIDADWEIRLGKKDIVIIIASMGILALWVFFSGIGSMSFQNGDHEIRNPIFRDLIEKSWPVIYDFGNPASPDKAFLAYYIALWLPAALVGKLFGLQAANWFLYFWCLGGIAIAAYFIQRIIRLFSIWPVLIFIFFSGQDVLGNLILSGKLPGSTWHIEAWTGIMQFSCNTTLLYWVFNQTIGPWIVILLILNMKDIKSLLFVYSLCLLEGPFPFLGLFPFVLCKIIMQQNYRWTNKFIDNIKMFTTEFYRAVLKCMTFQNIIGGFVILVISFIYLSGNRSGAKYSIHDVSKYYFIFLLIDVGLYATTIFWTERKNINYWIVLVSLMIIPWIRVGFGGDFCMRVSIPALLILMILIIKDLFMPTTIMKPTIPDKKIKQMSKSKAKKYLTPKIITSFWKEQSNSKRLQRIFLVVLLIIGAWTPNAEIRRSTDATIPQMFSTTDPKPYLKNKYPSINVLHPGMETDNFVGSINKSTFYKYLARK